MGGERIVSLFSVYTNITNAYTAARPHLGSSDYLSVMLIPAYRPLLTRVKPTVRQVRVWPEGAIEALQDCFECTDWDMFKAAATDNQLTNLEEYAASVSTYIQNCTENFCVTKYISSRTNEKPRMMQEIREKLKAQNTAFKSNDEAALRTARANLNRAFRIAKLAHAGKIQSFFYDPSNTRRIWLGIQAITDYKAAPPLCDNNPHLLNKLNIFFCCFGTHTNTSSIKASLLPDEATPNLCR